MVAVPMEIDDAEEADATTPTLPGFSGDQLRRLRELRAWLARRKQERLEGGRLEPERTLPRQWTVNSDRQVLTPLGQRYALGFEKNRHGPETREAPILRIGRGSDGRIHHRYVFRDQAGLEAEPETPVLAIPPEARRPAGTLISRQRVVRIFVPELPPDSPTSPRLEYEAFDSRR
jgi:hypothetical protein